ncbi:MAG TPA: hypothetical protein VF044_11280 [Actinomycetota bacterium]
MVTRRDSQQPIRGSSVGGPDRPTPRVPTGERTCAAHGCATKLSVYNAAAHCWIHAEPTPYVSRPVRRSPDEPAVIDPIVPSRVA